MIAKWPYLQVFAGATGEARDSHGRWTGGPGGGAVASKTEKKPHARTLAAGELDDFAANEFGGWERTLDPRMQSALGGYAMKDYQPINHGLRSGKLSADVHSN